MQTRPATRAPAPARRSAPSLAFGQADEDGFYVSTQASALQSLIDSFARSRGERRPGIRGGQSDRHVVRCAVCHRAGPSDGGLSSGAASPAGFVAEPRSNVAAGPVRLVGGSYTRLRSDSLATVRLWAKPVDRPDQRQMGVQTGDDGALSVCTSSRNSLNH